MRQSAVLIEESQRDGTPVPERRIARFEKMAYGLFIHWGLYSLLGRGEWIMNWENIPYEEYRPLMDRFTAKHFNAAELVQTAKELGFKYITFTTRHHEGFSLYDTKGLSIFDVMHSPVGRDLVAEFVDACRAEGILPILYHTTLDWSKGSQSCSEEEFEQYLDYLHDSVELLCRNYGPIGGLWFDGNWSRPKSDWKKDRLYGMIRKYQPEALIIDNTGLHEQGKNGHPEIDVVTFERGLPSPPDRRAHRKYLTGEMCRSMNMHWAYSPLDFNYVSPSQLIREFCCCRRAGANFLLDIGMSPDGQIPDYELSALRVVGQWIEQAGPVVYDGVPMVCSCEGDDFIVLYEGRLFYFAFDVPIKRLENVIISQGKGGPRDIFGLPWKIDRAVWLDNSEELKVDPLAEENAVSIHFTGYPYGEDRVVRIAELLGDA